MPCVLSGACGMTSSFTICSRGMIFVVPLLLDSKRSRGAGGKTKPSAQISYMVDTAPLRIKSNK